MAASPLLAGFDMTTNDNTIEAVGVASLRIMPNPLVLGDWVMSHRALALVGVRAHSGEVGWSYSLTREGPVEDMIRRYVVPAYVGKSLDDPAVLFEATRGRLRPVLGSGTGLRALSLVDIATWDVSARVAGHSLRDHLGGFRSSHSRRWASWVTHPSPIPTWRLRPANWRAWASAT